MATYFFETITAARTLAFCAGAALCFASDGADDPGAGPGAAPPAAPVAEADPNAPEQQPEIQAVAEIDGGSPATAPAEPPAKPSAEPKKPARGKSADKATEKTGFMILTTSKVQDPATGRAIARGRVVKVTGYVAAKLSSAGHARLATAAELARAEHPVIDLTAAA